MENKYSKFTDEQLIDMLRLGTEEITDYIMEKYKPLVRKKANEMYLIGGETDDLIQEGMIGLFKAVRDYKPEREVSFYHFAKLCITRQLYSAVEASNRKKHMPLNTYVSFNAQSEENGIALDELLLAKQTESPEQLFIENENEQDFYEALCGRLSKMERMVLDYYLDGCSYIQIAELMEKAPKSIDNALQRIRSKIRTMDEESEDRQGK